MGPAIGPGIPPSVASYDLLPITKRDLAKSFHRALAIDLGRGRHPMANVVAYDLEREIGIDQPLHTGVTKGMRARARDRNPRFAQIMSGPAGDRRIGERDTRCDTAEKEFAVSRLGSSVWEVIDYSVAHDSGKPIGSGMVNLPLRHIANCAHSHPIVAPHPD